MSKLLRNILASMKMSVRQNNLAIIRILSIEVIISFEGIIEVILKFQYISTIEDRSELRTWLFNNHLIVTAPKYYDRNSIFVDLENFIRCLKIETKAEYPLM